MNEEVGGWAKLAGDHAAPEERYNVLGTEARVPYRIHICRYKRRPTVTALLYKDPAGSQRVNSRQRACAWL